MIGHNTFAGAFVDRSCTRREDAAWLRAAMESADARFVPVWGDKCLARGEPPAAILAERDTVGEVLDPAQAIFLGMFRERPVFAVPLEGEPAPLAAPGDWHDLRYLGSVLPADEANLLAHARGATA